ncbi:uncharacterized protein LOC115757189 [Rhodamnia argentea]|uniref:Uncharacterized protein LOC115757189 n=1 Tax=Rhodamnia argentea TaxID=178133 RepID=A0A8B8R139_9MYRT|nr:uncharacterized protein LOC115757189 [Rhodamnia argentea]
MQATRDPPPSATERAEIQGKASEDSAVKVGTTVSRRGDDDPEAENMAKPLLSGQEAAEEEEEREREEDGGADDDVGGGEDEEFEFTFACTNPDGSPVAADAVFENGKIRPFYPLFDRKLLFADDDCDGGSSPPLRSPLRKLFVGGLGSASTSSSSSEEGDELAGVPDGTYCVWRGKTGEEASAEGCRKSNSTGFSKLWRFKELARRSSSDGKDAFVFLNPKRRGKEEGEKEGGKAATTSKGGKKGQTAATAATTTTTTAGEAHEKHYVKTRAQREGEKRKSYLPYKQVGFFTNVNGLSRNVHPF